MVKMTPKMTATMSNTSKPMAGAALGAGPSCGKPKLIAFGELLWDIFENAEHLGGSPANVAYHAALLGAESHLISRVGADQRGRAAISHLAASQVVTDDIQRDSARRTGCVTVTMANGSPRFRIDDHSAWDAIEAPRSLRLLENAHVFCFSTLAQRTLPNRRTLFDLLFELSRSHGARRTLRVLDLNLRPPHVDRALIDHSLRWADVVKVNDDELTWLENTLGGSSAARFILDRFSVRFLVVTHGARGATLFGHSLRVHCPGVAVAGGDPVGAGDAFVAAFSVALASNFKPNLALERANSYAAWVASETGAMPSKNARTPRVT